MRNLATRWAIAFALTAVAAQGHADGPDGAEQRRFAAGELALVHARLRDCPNRLRLLDVVRVIDASASMLDLAPVPILGRTPHEVQRDLERQYQERMPGRPVPPMRVARWEGNARDEVLWLLHAAEELESCGEEKRGRPDRSPHLRFEHLAAR
jgi:hypothetical protein